MPYLFLRTSVRVVGRGFEQRTGWCYLTVSAVQICHIPFTLGTIYQSPCPFLLLRWYVAPPSSEGRFSPHSPFEGTRCLGLPTANPTPSCRFPSIDHQNTSSPTIPFLFCLTPVCYIRQSHANATPTATTDFPKSLILHSTPPNHEYSLRASYRTAHIAI